MPSTFFQASRPRRFAVSRRFGVPTSLLRATVAAEQNRIMISRTRRFRRRTSEVAGRVEVSHMRRVLGEEY